MPTIRHAAPTDVPALIDLCEAHAHYERAPYARAGKAEGLARALFADAPKLYALVAENESGRLIAFATYMVQYATWDAQEYLYLDCLFVVEAARSQGLGERLMRRVQAEGERLGCTLVQWQTPDFNTRAIQFYHRIGATCKAKQRFFLTR
ncbi:MAG: GNAT family N-acetyltransferase [Bacteroidota bacterium]